MSMIAGDAAANTGMSGALYTNLNGITYSSNPATALQQFCDAMALAIVGYIQANATVSGTASSVTVGSGTAPVAGTVG